MLLKDNVVMAGLSLHMRPVLIAADAIWRRHGREDGVTVTSALDGLHSAGSLHYYGLALDFRTRYFTNDERMAVYSDLCYELSGEEYTVVLESDHIHVQFNQVELF